MSTHVKFKSGFLLQMCLCLHVDGSYAIVVLGGRWMCICSVLPR
jgi:hypothetical protein